MGLGKQRGERKLRSRNQKGGGLKREGKVMFKKSNQGDLITQEKKRERKFNTELRTPSGKRRR